MIRRTGKIIFNGEIIIPTNSLVMDMNPAYGFNINDNNDVVNWKEHTTSRVSNVTGNIKLTSNNILFNNKPTVSTSSGYFNGFDIGNSSSLTIFAVSSRNPGNVDGMVWALKGGSYSTTYDLWNSGGNRLGVNNYAGNCYGINIDQNIIESPYISTVQLVSNNINLYLFYINGVLQTGLSGDAESRILPPQINIASDNGQYLYSGNFARVLVYNRSLSSIEIDYINKTLKNEYGIL